MFIFKFGLAGLINKVVIKILICRTAVILIAFKGSP